MKLSSYKSGPATVVCPREAVTQAEWRFAGGWGMKLSSYKSGPATVVCPREAVTQAECEQVRLLVAEAALGGSKTIIIDLSEVPFVDSVGLEMLLELDRGCRDQGGRLKLVALSDNCSEILRLTELAPRFEILPSVEQAVRGLI
jgi:anti-sigma B factor antagonist